MEKDPFELKHITAKPRTEINWNAEEQKEEEKLAGRCKCGKVAFGRLKGEWMCIGCQMGVIFSLSNMMSQIINPYDAGDQVGDQDRYDIHQGKEVEE